MARQTGLDARERTTIAAEQAWHALAPEEVSRLLGVNPTTGLTAEEAAERLARAGPNLLPRAVGRRWPAILREQFAQFLVGVLLAATAISILLGEALDAVAIFSIVLLNAFLGFAQEYRAERAMESLRSLTAPGAKLRRDGGLLAAPADHVVPGDVVQLEAGDVVPGDARLFEAAALRVNEAALTGESVPVDKTVAAVPEEAQLAERISMVYQGSLVVYGRGLAVVVATGEGTEMGGIAALLGESPTTQTPLQQRLADMGRWLVYGTAGLCILVFGIGVAHGLEMADMLLTSASLAVAAIPEGLPAATTIVLALAVQRMVGRSVIVRRLAAVEGLGAVTTICVDKTGTLTENRMQAHDLWIDRRRMPPSDIRGAPATTLRQALVAAVLCNDATTTAGGERDAVGDPTEVALLQLAGGLGVDADAERDRAPRVDEIPFDAERARMTVVCRTAEGLAAFCKGAPEELVGRSRWLMVDGELQPLDGAGKQEVMAAAGDLAGQGMRVLALAQREVTADEGKDAIEHELTLLGLVALADPLRPEARPSIEEARAAGVRTIMLTGDHPVTAAAIAGELGLQAEPIVVGRQLEELSDEQLGLALTRADVYARVSSRHKLRLVTALQRLGQRVAMTGDGINDAPALKAADIGVAMGLGGTDIAREASDIVLTDNNFRSIVAAMEEGRRVYDNIRKFVHYLLVCNLAEVMVVFVVLTFGGTTPLLPLQILWINLLTDGLPALALGLEPGEPDVMQRPPRSPSAGILGPRSLAPLLGIGGLVAASALGAYMLGRLTGDEGVARQLTFATLVGAQLAASFNFRSATRSTLRLPANHWMLGALGLSTALLFLVFYVPVLQEPFDTGELSVGQWLAVLGLSLVPLVAVELVKLSGALKRFEKQAWLG